MDRHPAASAAECLEQMRLQVSPSEFGFRVQGLAAHVLVALGYRVSAVNESGHPDIVAFRGGREFRFEVEAEVGRSRLRQLTEADFEALLGTRGTTGYYALAIGSPTPYWVLAHASKLVGRPPMPNILLEALSDKEFSAEWTREYTRLLEVGCRRIQLASFVDLKHMALSGRRIAGPCR